MTATEAPDLMAYIESRLIQPRPDCIVWTGAADRGYGRIYVDGTAKRVHRVVWELKHGPIPDGLTIDHLCRVKPCVNTAHMELVTASENSLRGVPFKRRAIRSLDFHKPGPPREQRPLKTHCLRGHEYTEENTQIRGGGARECRTCRKARRASERARRREQRAAERAA